MAITARRVRCSIRGDGYPALIRALRNLTPFTTSGALYGDAWNQEVVSRYELGHLNDAEANRFMLDHLAGIRFVVWSYSTPVAWVRSDGEVYHVAQRFSVTSNRHQGLARSYLAQGLAA